MTAALCRWYAFCENVTTTGLAHPALGLVPCCERCASRVDLAAELVPLPDDGAPIASFVPVNVCPCGGTTVVITLRGGIACASCGTAV